jgi:hypothetical protein
VSPSVFESGDALEELEELFTETKEAIGGSYLIRCESRDEALEFAARVPQSPRLVVGVLAAAEI